MNKLQVFDIGNNCIKMIIDNNNIFMSYNEFLEFSGEVLSMARMIQTEQDKKYIDKYSENGSIIETVKKLKDITNEMRQEQFKNNVESQLLDVVNIINNSYKEMYCGGK